MSTTKLKRKLQAIFMNTTPKGETETYSLVGVNVSDLSIAYNPQTVTEQDIVSDTAQIEVTGYQPNAAITQQATKGDPVYDFINTLRRNRAILQDAHTDIVLVDLYELKDEETPDVYVAEKQGVSIQIDTYGGAGTEPLSIGYTINFRGDAVKGSFNASTKIFTEDGDEDEDEDAN